ESAIAAGGLQLLQIWQCGRFQRPKEEAEALLDLQLSQLAIFAAVAPRRVVLHIDDQERRMVRIDLDLAAQTLRHAPCSRSRPSASGRRRAKRAAHAACPVGSAIKSWRISISTCGRPRPSPCTGTV